MTGLTMVQVAYDMYPNEFRWKEPPYEYVYDRNPFDVIAGSSSIREAIESGKSLEAMHESWGKPLEAFKEMRREYFLY